MTLRIGTGGDTDKLYVGSDVVQKVYQGSTLVWSAVTPNAFVTSVADYTIDKNVWDSGAAFGANRAFISVPDITTDATDGHNIEARIIRTDTDAEVHPWQVIGTAASGALTGAEYTVATGARNANWLALEVRAENTTAPAGGQTTEFAIGHHILQFGQSESFQTANYSTPGVGGLSGFPADAERFQITRPTSIVRAGGSSTGDITDVVYDRKFIASGSGGGLGGINEGVDFLSNYIGATDKVMWTFDAISGTGREMLADDAKGRRKWDTDGLLECLNLAGRTDGCVPGLVITVWGNAAATQFGADYYKSILPFYTGVDVDGNTVPLGSTLTYKNTSQTGTVSYDLDHILFDVTGAERGLFDYNRTKLYESNYRFDTLFDLTNLISSGISTAVLESVGQEALREAMYKMSQNADFQTVGKLGIMTAFPLNTGSTTLGIHYEYENAGVGAMGRWWGLTAAHAMGYISDSDANPEFDAVTYAGDGTGATFSSSQGSVTTTRRLRSEAFTPDASPHRNEVMGFDFMGVPIEAGDAVINAGGVDLTTPSSFNPALVDWSRDVFRFGGGFGSGATRNALDASFAAYKDYPVLDPAAVGSGLAGFTMPSVGEMGVPFRQAAHNVVAHSSYNTRKYVEVTGKYFQSDTIANLITAGDIAGSSLPACTYEVSFYVPHQNLIDEVFLFGLTSARGAVSLSRNWFIKTEFQPNGGSVSGEPGIIYPSLRYDLTMNVDISDLVAANKVCEIQINANTAKHVHDFGTSTQTALTSTKQFFFGGNTTDSGATYSTALNYPQLFLRHFKVYESADGSGVPFINIDAETMTEAEVLAFFTDF